MIRLARRADLPCLADIQLSAGELFRGTHMDFAADHPPTPLEDFEAACADATLWVSEADGQCNGMLLAEASRDDLHILELAVAASAQRRGIGSALLAAAIAGARAHGLASLTLTTDRTLPWNAPFYARNGFVILTPEATPGWLRAI
ncbi:MAG TPA: GNAT family N-acetyltransferase, partial [Polymorphobacter sp.]|nr:GNAT family N-acetyltransferase [Polymorphobacter sp.]